MFSVGMTVRCRGEKCIVVASNLQVATGETVTFNEDIEAPVSTTEGPEWEQARQEGRESPQELNLLKAIRADRTLSEPEKQLKVYDQNKILTRADFAYTDCEPKPLISGDGLAFHSEVRQRFHDNRITNRLQVMGYRVLRFLGTKTHNTPEACVAEIKQARPI